MPYSYEKLWNLAAERGLNKTSLRDACSITSASLSRLSKNENVSMDVLDRICTKLNCKVEDIVEHISHNHNEVNNSMKFIDLFAGIGGFRIAGEEHGMDCVFSSEIDRFANEVYKTNFGEYPSGDITKINACDIPDFDVLFAGFPCQPFSYAGQLQGFDDATRGTLFFDIVRIIKEKRPKMFLLENVKGLMSHEKGKTLRIIIDQLKKLNYDVHSDILNSIDYGVPQSRERWYCVGFDKNVKFSFPNAHKNKTTLRNIVDKAENANGALKLTDFEMNRINYHFSVCPADQEEQIRVKHDNSKYAPNTKKGKYGIYSYLKSDKSLRFHVGDYAKTQIQEAYYCNLDSYTPSIIVARAPKLWDIGRYLSDRECARLQGFPENFILSSSSAQAKKQLGNSVTITVVTQIVENMINAYKI